MTEPKRIIDWEAIEKEYRVGQLSIRQIAKQHNISYEAIRKRIKRDGWTQNLADRVRQAVVEKLVVSAIDTANVRQVVDQAAGRGVDVVLRHRAGLSRQNDHLIALQEKLEELIPAVKTMDDVGKAQDIVESMARTRRALIPLERQAFSLDESAPTANETLKPLMELIDGQSRGLPAGR